MVNYRLLTKYVKDICDENMKDNEINKNYNNILC